MLGRRWIVLCVVFLARTAMGFQFQSIASVGPLLSEAFSVDNAEIGTLIGLYFLPGVVIAFPGGLLARRLGDKRICSVGLGLMVVGGLLLGASHDYGTAFVGRGVSGAGAILFNLVVTKMTADWFADREIVFAMAVLLASWPFGVAAGLILHQRLGASFGWPSVMDMAALPSALALALIALAYRSPAAHETTAPASAGPALGVEIPWQRQLVPLVLAGTIWGCGNAALVLFLSFAPQLLGKFGYSPHAAASLPSTALWIVMLSAPVGGYLIERFGKADTGIVLFCAAAALAIMLICLDISPPLLCAALGLVIGPPSGAMLALPARILGARQRAAGLGLFFTCYYAVMSIAPAIGGWLQDSWGTPAAALQLASALFLAIAPLLLVFQRLVAQMPANTGSILIEDRKR